MPTSLRVDVGVVVLAVWLFVVALAVWLWGIRPCVHVRRACHMVNHNIDWIRVACRWAAQFAGRCSVGL